MYGKGATFRFFIEATSSIVGVSQMTALERIQAVDEVEQDYKNRPLQ